MVRKEIFAGLSTFFTAAYLVLLYPQILSEGGIDFGSGLSATIIIIVLATLFLAFYANFPALLAPGMSVGPYLVYSVILKEGASWQSALGVVFWVGLLLFMLTLLKVRQKIFLHLPHAIKYSSIAGIGLFLICVGLKNLKVLIQTPTFFELGPIWTIPNLIALSGLCLYFILHRFKISSAFLIAILSCWLIGLASGYAEWQGFAALPASLFPTFLQLDLWTPLHPKWIGTIGSVLLISLFDSTASLTVLAKLAHKFDHSGKIKNIDRILVPDGTGSMAAALLGTGTLTYTLESSSGIAAGGRTGITAAVAAFCCLICLFFLPLISSIPLFATAPALIAIGCSMAREARSIEWADATEAIPALLTLAIIPLTFNILNGFIVGFISYVILKSLANRFKEIHPVCWALSLAFILYLLWKNYFV